jgi:UPF0755 protein
MFKLVIYLFIFIILFLALGTVFALYGLYQFYAPVGGSEAKTIEIQEGQTVKQIADSLVQQNLIRSSFWFKTYVWLSQIQNKLQAGKYSISPNSSLVQITQIISQGKVTENDTWVTIPEGFTLAQIQARMIDSGLDVAQNLNKEVIGEFKSNYLFLSDAPQSLSLEGFLFPDTYKFKKDAGLREITIKILDNFDKKLTPQMRQDIAKQNRSIFEIITMAGILEKEVKTGDDLKMVSGIFWNRIKDKYPLETDATLSYIFGDKEDRHTIEQTKVDSPYNTYKYAGLPPGPISNPGIKAIEAAIYPQESDYYFFLTKPDTGEAVFSKTLEEHNLNKAKYLK